MTRFTTIILAAACFLALAPDSQAGLFRHHRKARQACAPTASYQACATTVQATYQATTTTYATTQVQATVTTTGGDPYGFTAWLNGYRAQNGRGPVGFDPGLAAEASANNGQQHARGMGHHFMGSARRQNSGMGGSTTVWQMWTASPAHNAALLDPSITSVGIASSGSYWTFNAR